MIRSNDSINEPSVDKLINKLEDENQHPVSRYELCIVVSKRARQIIEQIRNLPKAEKKEQGKTKEIREACREVESGAVRNTKE